jgi:hypothetical protein
MKPAPRILPVLLLAVLALGLAACGGRLTQANLDKVKMGMSEDQVAAILGKPSRTEVSDNPLIKSSVYIYEKGDSKVSVTFVNGSVLTSQGTFSN